MNSPSIPTVELSVKSLVTSGATNRFNTPRSLLSRLKGFGVAISFETVEDSSVVRTVLVTASVVEPAASVLGTELASVTAVVIDSVLGTVVEGGSVLDCTVEGTAASVLSTLNLELMLTSSCKGVEVKSVESVVVNVVRVLEGFGVTTIV